MVHGGGVRRQAGPEGAERHHPRQPQSSRRLLQKSNGILFFYFLGWGGVGVRYLYQRFKLWPSSHVSFYRQNISQRES